MKTLIHNFLSCCNKKETRGYLWSNTWRRSSLSFYIAAAVHWFTQMIIGFLFFSTRTKPRVQYVRHLIGLKYRAKSPISCRTYCTTTTTLRMNDHTRLHTIPSGLRRTTKIIWDLHSQWGRDTNGLARIVDLNILDLSWLSVLRHGTHCNASPQKAFSFIL